MINVNKIQKLTVIIRNALEYEPDAELLETLDVLYEMSVSIETLVQEAVTVGGGHHKQWYLEQIAEKLGVALPDHDEGVVP